MFTYPCLQLVIFLLFFVKMDCGWTDVDVITLINLFETNPPLYDVTVSDYRNKEKKKMLLHSIAATLNKPGKCRRFLSMF